jgi:hypothetical protein
MCIPLRIDLRLVQETWQSAATDCTHYSESSVLSTLTQMTNVVNRSAFPLPQWYTPIKREKKGPEINPHLKYLELS